MRILIITGSFPPLKCGVGDYTSCLVQELRKRTDVNVAVLTSESLCRLESDLPSGIMAIVKNWNINEFPGIAKFIRRWRPDVVHIQYPTQGYFGGGRLPFFLPALLSLMKIKIVQTWHEYYTESTASWHVVLKVLAPGPIVVVRPQYADYLPPFYRRLIKKNRLHFIPNASSLPRVSLTNDERLAIHARYAPATRTLVAYFGFLYPHKGIDDLFDIADPDKHHLVLIGAIDEADPYHQSLRVRASRGDWAGKVTITGFLPSEEAARLLAAADAVVLPFRGGGGLWNTSLHGAALQGTFIATTSDEKQGYDSDTNIFSAKPGDVASMRQALIMYAGRRNTTDNIRNFATWDSIVEAHLRIYRTLLT